MSSFRDLPEYYRMYAAHLNAPNAIRDATANEKLFEIAACGRLSINLDSPDVRSCYDPGEIVLVDSLAALEAAAEQVLRDPDAALASGEKAPPPHRRASISGTTASPRCFRPKRGPAPGCAASAPAGTIPSMPLFSVQAEFHRDTRPSAWRISSRRHPMI